MREQSFSAEFGGDHKIIDDFTWKESWRSSVVANIFIVEEPQTEILGSIQDELHVVTGWETPFPVLFLLF